MKNNKLTNNRNVPSSYRSHKSASKSTLSLLLLVSVTLLVSEGCAVKPPSAIDAKSPAASQAKPIEIKISSTEFNYKPSKIKVKEGQEVTFTLDNRQGAIEHDFVIKELGIHLLAKAGQETSQKLIGVLSPNPRNFGKTSNTAT